MENIDSVLDAYRKELNLPVAFKGNAEEARKYYDMSRKQLESLTMGQLEEGIYFLSTFALSLQLAINRLWAKHNYLDRTIKKHIAPKLRNYSGKWDHQEYQAIKDDSYALKLEEQRAQTKLKIDDTNYLATTVRHCSESLANIQKGRNARHE